MAYTKVTRDQIASYLNVTPKSDPSWKIIGVGITDYSISFNPQNTTEKWIIHRNATTTLDSYQIQGDVTQKCYKGDDVYDYINDLRRKASIGDENNTQVIDIDLYDESEGKYKATKYDCVISVSSYGGGDDAEIEYTISYNGDPTLGYVTISAGEITFTEDAG